MIRNAIEALRTPPEVERRIAQAGGLNIFGEPNFVVRWGLSHLEWIGGLWEAKDDGSPDYKVEYRKVPVWDPLDRWHLGRWMPPSFYGDDYQWRQATEKTEGPYTYLELGPRPARGKYEHSLTIETTDHGYVALTPKIVDWIVRRVVRSKVLMQLDKKQNYLALKERVKRAEQGWDEFADAVLGEADSPWEGREHIYVPGGNEVAQYEKQRLGI